MRKLLVILGIFIPHLLLHSYTFMATNGYVSLISITKEINGELDYNPYRGIITLRFGTNIVEFFEYENIFFINSNYVGVTHEEVVKFTNNDYYIHVSTLEYIITSLKIPSTITNFSEYTPFNSSIISSQNYPTSSEDTKITQVGSGNISKIEKTNQLKNSEFLPFKFVIVDAGHGGKDPGAIHNSVKEKDLTLEYAKLIYSKLKEILPKEVSVIMTRDKDIYLSLEERTKIAENTLKKYQGYGIFLSIHMNASINKSKKGIEIYYVSEEAVDSDTRETIALENSFISKTEISRIDEIQKIISKIKSVQLMEESKILSDYIAKGFVNTDVKLKGGPFYVIKYIPVPSILIEIGYISNLEDLRKIKSSDFQKSFSDNVAKQVLEFFETYNSTKGFIYGN